MTDTATERIKAIENANHYAYARDNGHLDFVKKARRCENFFHGYENKQWDPAVAAKLRAQRKPVLTINKIFPTLGTVMGEQLQNQVDISFRAANAGNPDTAIALDKVWVYISNNNHLDWVRSEVADDGFIKSRGFFDVRMMFDENLTGDIVIRRENPYNVLLPVDDASYDPDEWNNVIISRWVTSDDVRLLYGKSDVADILEKRTQSNMGNLGYDFIDSLNSTFGNPGQNDTAFLNNRGRRLIRLIERQHKVLRRIEHFVDPATGETRPVPNNWDHNRIARVVQQTGVLVIPRQTKVLRWTVSADDFLLFDEDSPYKHFTIVPFFPFFRDGKTIGLVENLLSPQESLNKTRSQELHIVNTTANSGWKVKAGALQNMSIYELEERGAETGLALELDDINNIDKISPNQVPTGLDRISFKNDEDIKQISNVGDSQRGLDRADVSGRAIEAKQLRGSVNLAKPFFNLIRSDHLVARNTVDLVQEFMTEQRTLVITGDDPGKTAQDITVNQVTPEGEILNDLTLGEYSVITAVVPVREQQEDSIFEQMIGMREKLGIDIPDSAILENSKLPNKREIIDNLAKGDAPRQQLQDIELKTKQAELEKITTESAVKRADAVDKIARAQKNSQTGDAQAQDPELLLKQHKIDGELAIQRQKVEGELALAQEKVRREHAIQAEKLRLEEMKIKGELNVKKKAAAKAPAQSNAQ